MPSPGPSLSAWRFVTVFGTVSLLADVVYEGARSITGPLLASLGATALVVGLVTGIGEAAALALRVVSGPLTDRTQRFWAWTIAGYALTVVTVPFLGVTATLWVACALVIAERVGKAVRSPAKDTLLSHATHVTGRGVGFAVHEALDQIGAMLGPLTVAGMLVLTGGDYGPALGVLAAPGTAVLALLIWLRWRVPRPSEYEPVDRDRQADGSPVTTRAPLPREFWLYCAFTATTMVGFATFGVLSFHMVTRGLLPPAAVPVIYAAAMAADAVAALASGWLYDRVGPVTLAALPVLALIIPTVAFTNDVTLVIAGALAWGAAVGIQESTLRAVVADLVAPPRRATAYGLFAAGMGAATAAGGALTGWLYDTSVPALIATVAGVQLVAVALAAVALRRRRAATTAR
ncbi:MFS transporter [Mycolicibacterium chitae]|uniref:Major facilitator superfamily n=1 Tax=Mycolicibacterium chitae TaxID=1792 RepID=A0A3S4TPZ4_MYCCI|nr:MFS transporter [Mycolicibacterium chitae]MCV7108149.1 MFS transporter [Mycolicibacterium chitae]VEG50008.1 major facilitator superfamily [Mycolicibacterium chitae]